MTREEVQRQLTEMLVRMEALIKEANTTDPEHPIVGMMILTKDDPNNDDDLVFGMAHNVCCPSHARSMIHCAVEDLRESFAQTPPTITH